MNKRVYIVGAGLFGSVFAERCANVLHLPVTVIDKRAHIGGNCYSETDLETGVEYHKYGSHIFHTSNKEVWEYITSFSEFNHYCHRVYTVFGGEVFPMPINLGTINQFYRKAMSPIDARKLIHDEIIKEKLDFPENLEEKAISLIGRPLYEAFFRGYTIKQWEKEPYELAADIITRLPIRYNYDNRYFSDIYEGIPVCGYGELFAKILDNPLIEVLLNTSWEDFKCNVKSDDVVIYTGAIDAFFLYELGSLEWRTIDFEIERYSYPDYQGTTVMNFADANVPYTRIHEFKHYHPERPDTGKTIIFKEYSRFAKREDELYYPVFTGRNQQLFDAYSCLATKQVPNVVFCGRLGQFKYFDMDDTIAEALNMFKRCQCLKFCF